LNGFAIGLLDDGIITNLASGVIIGLSAIYGNTQASVWKTVVRATFGGGFGGGEFLQKPDKPSKIPRGFP